MKSLWFFRLVGHRNYLKVILWITSSSGSGEQHSGPSLTMTSSITATLYFGHIIANATWCLYSNYCLKCLNISSLAWIWIHLTKITRKWKMNGVLTSEGSTNHAGYWPVRVLSLSRSHNHSGDQGPVQQCLGRNVPTAGNLPAPCSPVVSWTRTEAGHRAASGQAGQLTADSRDNTLDTPSVLCILHWKLCYVDTIIPVNYYWLLMSSIVNGIF